MKLEDTHMNSFNTYGFEGIRASGNEKLNYGYHKDHMLDNNDWAYNKRFRFGEENANHFGKGPKGYTRKDEKIKEDVCDSLTENIWVDASDIEVSVDHGIVKLEGKTTDRSQKKAAEACVEDISGVKDVLNYLTIKEDHGLIGEANIDLKMI